MVSHIKANEALDGLIIIGKINNGKSVTKDR